MHQFTVAHQKRFKNRTPALCQKLQALWGLTWRLRGKRYQRLGDASAMVMSYRPNHIELSCVTAGVNTETRMIEYNRPRMSHDFSRAPVPGGTGRVLDPNPDFTRGRPTDRPNGSWCELAMDVDAVATKLASDPWNLPVIPELPVFCVGVYDKQAIQIEDSHSVRMVLVEQLGCEPRQVFEMPKAERDTHIARIWDSLWTPPNEDTDGQWLLPVVFCPTQWRQQPQIWEDFSQLVGRRLTNPVRIMKHPSLSALAHCMQTVLAEMAPKKERVIETCDTTAPYGCSTPLYSEPMTPTVFSSPYDDAIDDMTAAIAQSCRKGVPVTFQCVYDAVKNPDQWIPSVWTRALMRQWLQKNRGDDVAAAVTDADLDNAMRHPEDALVVSNLAKIQIMALSSAPLTEALQFNAVALARPGVSANFHVGEDWTPRKGLNAKTQHFRTDPRVAASTR